LRQSGDGHGSLVDQIEVERDVPLALGEPHAVIQGPEFGQQQVTAIGIGVAVDEHCREALIGEGPGQDGCREPADLLLPSDD
jgi:hypothetical protein